MLELILLLARLMLDEKLWVIRYTIKINTELHV
jgi:hypothetical protein